MGKGKQMSTIGKILSYAVVLLLLAAIIVGIIYYFVRDSDSTFYIEYGGEKLTDSQCIELPTEKEIRFDCKTILGGTVAYTVSVVPYTSNRNNFEYSVDGRLYIFSGITADLAAAFNVEKSDGFFTLTTDTDMIAILKAVYPSGTITVPDLDYSATEYFAIVITPDGGAAITIPFKSNFNIGVHGIDLDKEYILL